jgi:Ca-activated chloride channel homolog
VPNAVTAAASHVVNVPFFAEKGRSKPEKEITSSDLSILDDGKPRQSVVAVLTAKESPLRLGILIDSSSSEMASSLYRPALSAMTDMIHQMLHGPDDKVFIVNFSSSIQASAFMNQQEFVKFRINATPGGAAAFFDAVQFACKDRMAADQTEPARRVLVMLTDGGDNQSHVTNEEAIITAQKAGTVIFAVSTSPVGIGDGALRQFGEKTGGHAFLT